MKITEGEKEMKITSEDEAHAIGQALLNQERGWVTEKGNTMKKHPITIVLKEETHEALKKRAEAESRPVAQMARVIIEKELKGDKS